MKFVARLIIPLEADGPDEVQEMLMTQIRNGITTNCHIEIAQVPSEEEKEVQQGISFRDMLNNLNSKDMTKN